MRRSHHEAQTQVFGTELIMDIDGCDPETISDGGALKQYVMQLVELIDMKAYGATWLHHFGHANPLTSGYTAFQAIETSSIVLHVGEAEQRVHINVFSCRRFDPDKALDFSEQYFDGTDTTYSVLSR